MIYFNSARRDLSIGINFDALKRKYKLKKFSIKLFESFPNFKFESYLFIVLGLRNGGVSESPTGSKN